MQTIKVKGKIEFEPPNLTKKHKKQASWKRVAMIRMDCDIHLYYGWFLKRRFNLRLNPPYRGAHVTFISEIVDTQVFEEAKKVFHGKDITLFLEIEPRGNGEHWWLRAFSPEAEDIRESMGLARQPFFTFHLTIGIVNEKYLEHSKYIIDQCKFFNLIDGSPRKPLEDHEIVEFRL